MNISSSTTYLSQKVIYTWIPTDKISRFKPITQVYGVCLNDQNQVLICCESKNTKWGLPGGTIEKRETPVETLMRELQEEVDIQVDRITLIGVQQVNFSKNPNPAEGDLFYQARYFCKIKKLLTQTVDPDTGLIYQRRFVPLPQLNEHLKWGKIGDVIVAGAVRIAKNIL
jgi:8-oxo-dGTP pyrophosphatase MutT (NUDIX family)